MVLWDLLPWGLSDMGSDFEKLPDLHPATKKALNCTETWKHQEFQRLILYVDGSYCQRSQEAGWAVVALVDCEGDLRLVGAWADSICMFLDRKDTLGKMGAMPLLLNLRQ